MPIGEKDVEKVARLARLELEPEELARMAHAIDGFTAHMDKLRNLDLSGVEPMMRVEDSPRPLRPDEARPSLDRDEVFRNAPAVNRGHFSIPKVIG